MPPVIGTATMGVVAAKRGVPRNLRPGQDFRRVEVREDVNEAKPPSARRARAGWEGAAALKVR